jgi:hypothetical protein
MLVYPGGADISNLHTLPVAVDTQVRKVTKYLGLANPEGKNITPKVRKAIQEAWRRDIEVGDAIKGPSVLINTAAALDPAVWFVASWGCT